ncbi:MAG: hypothetical protein ACK4KT_04670 [Thermaurantimonas sp.]
MKLLTAAQGVRSIQLAVFALKVPYLFVGYGPEEDAWGHVYNIIEMYEEGHYIISRLPGHPAYEALMFLFFPLIKFPFIINGLSALAGSLAIGEFFRLMCIVRTKHSILWTLAFGLFPAFFIGSTYAIDYAFTTWLMLRGVRLLLQGNYTNSGVYIGLSAAFRITSLALLLPAVILMFQKKVNFRYYVYFLASSSFVAGLFYLPAILTYGSGFFDFHRPPGSGFLKAFYKFLPGAWGVLGSAGILLLLIFFIKSLRKEQLREYFKNPVILFSLLTVALFTTAYVCLPEKSAFTIPIYSFLMLICASQQIRYIRFILVTLCASIFIMGVQFVHPYRGIDPSDFSVQHRFGDSSTEFSPFKGLYFSELEKRKNKNKFAQCAYKALSEYSDSNMVVIAGWWYANLKTIEWNRQSFLNVHLVYYLTEDQVQDYLRQGYTIRHLEELHLVNDRLKRTKLKNSSKKIEISCI